jgi:hypothetical protein
MRMPVTDERTRRSRDAPYYANWSMSDGEGQIAFEVS